MSLQHLVRGGGGWGHCIKLERTKPLYCRGESAALGQSGWGWGHCIRLERTKPLYCRGESAALGQRGWGVGALY